MRLDARTIAWTIAVLAAVTVGGALALQNAGYAPCELCLKERLPYYVGMPVALMAAMAVRFRSRPAAVLGFGLLIVIFVASAALGFFHAGVEWKFWPGPSECSGTAAAPAKIDDFLRQLDRVSVVRCDEAALRIFGLSLTVWNGLISLVLVALANVGLLKSAALGSIPPRAGTESGAGQPA